jgi:hypothetical protein
MRAGKLPTLPAQPWELMTFIQILIDFSIEHATDYLMTALKCTPEWRAQVHDAFSAAIAASIPKTCSLCRKSHAFGLVWYAFEQAKFALSWMPLREEMHTLALDNLAMLNAMCVHTCPVLDVIKAHYRHS